ncbi:MAG TPA: hypothetical protein PLG90_06830 [Ignavibacteria bacterium]|nr:hypothetical protein [Ignavibacteria bacterium]
MKFIKSILIVVAVMFAFTAVTYAQSDSKKGKSPEEFATKKATKMKEKLSLTDEQYKQVYDIFYANSTKMLELRNSTDKEGRKEAMRQNRESVKNQLAGVLTSSQLEQWNKMKSEKKGKYKDGKKNKKNKNKLQK